MLSSSVTFNRKMELNWEGDRAKVGLKWLLILPGPSGLPRQRTRGKRARKGKSYIVIYIGDYKVPPAVLTA